MGKRSYQAIWLLSKLYYACVFPPKVIGKENIPADGAFLLCANHFNARDPFYISACLPINRWMRFLGKKELDSHRLIGPIMRAVGVIPVERGKADIAAMRTSFSLLKEGFALGIFPQGTRSRGNIPSPMQTGAAMIALRSGVPVVPVYVDGPYRLFRRTRVIIGKPLSLEEFGRRIDAQALNGATKLIESAIWDLR